MNRTAGAILATIAALTLASCSNAGSEPKATVTATKTPELSAKQKRAACVEAWSKAIDRWNADTDALLNSDPYQDAKPAECGGLPGQPGMYIEALQTRNQAKQDQMQACLDDPTCTAFPLP
ncbi:hypothetical protein ACFWJM_03900 [Streptomyces sp. NPDC127077]|uniref:hypothetical protein n=1 Tax=Streptomyces sp. NPDC127077 TaxID=3347131 RepID=UPI003651D77C